MPYKNSINNSFNEINILNFLKLLLKKKNLIFIITFIISTIAIIYSLLLTPLYTSFISIYPENLKNSKNSLSQFEGIASTFGINIGGDESNSFNIPDIINSRMLKKEVLLKRWVNIKFQNESNLITYWEIDTDSKFSLKKFVSNLLRTNNTENNENKHLELGIKILSGRISTIEEESGLIIISVLMEEPEMSANISNFIAEYLKSFIGNKISIESSERRKFIEKRLENSKKDLSLSEEKLTSFIEKHPLALDTPDLQLERGRLIRNIEVNQQVYIILRQQYEVAKIDELNKSTIINILDKGEPAVEKTSPQRVFIVISFFFIGLIFSIIYLYLNQRIKIIIQQLNQ
jgi:uncharacterized protein involved in exopolysaccharide biosynthesis